MLYTIWYLDKNLQGVTERDDAVLVEVEDHKNGIAGQMSIDEFELHTLPMTISDDGLDLLDLNTVLAKDKNHNADA